MTAPPITAALVDALVADADALDRLARALAPRLDRDATADTTAGALTASGAAQRAGVHARTVRRALAAGTLTGRVIAGRWRVEPDDLDAWLSAGAPTSGTPTHRNGRPRPTDWTDGATAIAGRERT